MTSLKLRFSATLLIYSIITLFTSCAEPQRREFGTREMHIYLTKEQKLKVNGFDGQTIISLSYHLNKWRKQSLLNGYKLYVHCEKETTYRMLFNKVLFTAASLEFNNVNVTSELNSSGNLIGIIAIQPSIILDFFCVTIYRSDSGDVAARVGLQNYYKKQELIKRIRKAADNYIDSSGKGFSVQVNAADDLYVADIIGYISLIRKNGWRPIILVKKE